MYRQSPRRLRKYEIERLNLALVYANGVNLLDENINTIINYPTHQQRNWFGSTVRPQ
jgi:hypothetical protein